MIDKNSLRKRFSASAYDYESHAFVQKKMARKVIKDILKVSRKQKSPNILEVGCGTGYLTRLLLKEFESPNILALDIAPGMIAESKKKLGESKIKFWCEDIESVELEAGYDLVVSNATFQWLDDMESTLLKLIRCLKKGGSIIFSTFGEDTFRELNDSFRKASLEKEVLDGSRLGQRLYGLAELKQMLESSVEKIGLNCKISIEEKMEYEYFDSARDFLYSIKKIGANSNSEMRVNSPGVIKRTMQIYDQNYRERDKIRASYHCVYVVVER